jgi:hypothetical protein
VNSSFIVFNFRREKIIKLLSVRSCVRPFSYCVITSKSKSIWPKVKNLYRKVYQHVSCVRGVFHVDFFSIWRAFVLDWVKVAIYSLCPAFLATNERENSQAWHNWSLVDIDDHNANYFGWRHNKVTWHKIDLSDEQCSVL